MLSEITCKQFVDDGCPRGIIAFNKGLNVVLGSRGGANSIGKTTFLLAVDYAFGGSTYSAQGDILLNVGAHDICFSHRIEGIEHRFLRSTETPKIVFRCTDDYVPVDEIGIQAFNEWLLKAYGLQRTELSFRGAVGPCLRIYGKKNLDERHPLVSHDGESMREGIGRLIGLFGERGAVKSLENEVVEAKATVKTFNDALKREFVAAASTQVDYRENERRIAELSKQLEEIEISGKRGTIDAGEIAIEELADQKAQCASLKRKRARLRVQLKRIVDEGSLDQRVGRSDLKHLEAFFPGCDLKSIEDIESFHKGLATILRKERDGERQRIAAQISLLDGEIDRLEARIAEGGAVSSLSTVVLRKYASLTSESTALEKANDAYEKKRELGRVSKKKEQELRERLDCILKSIESQINARMAELNASVAGEDKSTPVLKLKAVDSYSFGIFGDTGTGANVRAMELFDLALLDLTPLPVLACDSSALKQLADDVLLNLLNEFSKREKQSFVAIDRAESLAANGLPRSIEDAVVIRLRDGHELFGKSWAKGEGAAK